MTQTTCTCTAENWKNRTVCSHCYITERSMNEATEEREIRKAVARNILQGHSDVTAQTAYTLLSEAVGWDTNLVRDAIIDLFPATVDHSPTTTERDNLKESTRRRYTTKLKDRGIPADMTTIIVDYLVDGRPMGHFLLALFSNDLVVTYARADKANRALIPVYVDMLHNDIPDAAWGSEAIVHSWGSATSAQ